MKRIRLLPFLIIITCITSNLFADDRNITIKKVESFFSQIQPLFIENKGQEDEIVHFTVKGLDRSLYFTSTGLTLVLDNDGLDKSEIINIEYLNAREGVVPFGLKKRDTRYNYFKGTPDQWKTNISCFDEIIYHELWEGVDLIFTSSSGKIKYRYEVHPGVDPEQIRLKYTGARELKLDEEGELIIRTDFTDIRDERPIAFQFVKGQEKQITLRYSLNEEPLEGVYTVGFEIESYDHSKPLIIDPAILLLCGYIGGAKSDIIEGIAQDEYGNLFVTGVTKSSSTSFPVIVGPDLTQNGYGDAFVAKINCAGTHLEYCGYIGGTNYESGLSIDVDLDGNAYIMGYTLSTEDDSFPVLNGPDLSYNGGDDDVFVAKINATGSSLEYCGYIGGEEKDCDEAIGDIAVDNKGNAYVTSSTRSDQTTFPVKIGPCLTHKGSSDAFIAKVNKSGQELDYCGYIGGSSIDVARGVAVNLDGNAYVSGVVMSTEAQGFPVKRGPDLSYNGGWSDSFVAKVDPTGTDLLFCGYIGGLEADNCSGLVLDSGNNYLYISGSTSSDETSFPVLIGPDLTYNSHGSSDAFIAKINAKNTAIEYCGYIGGIAGDRSWAVDVDLEGNAYLVGDTESKDDSFPVKEGPELNHYGMGSDAYIASVSPDGSSLNYCGYIGGKGKDKAYSVTVDKLGNACMAGLTDSTERTFPVVNGPDLTSNSPDWGEYEGFIAKVMQKGVCCQKYRLSSKGDHIIFDLLAGRENANRHYVLLGSLNSTNPGYSLPGGKEYLPFLWDGLTDVIILNLNSTTFNNFIGTLDNAGCASAQLRTDRIRPEFEGFNLYFAFCLNNPFDFVSNPVGIKIIK